jgi:hypothetical protein
MSDTGTMLTPTDEQGAFQAWLATPSGILAIKYLTSMLKAGLVIVAAWFPKLGLGSQVDTLAQELAVPLALAGVAWWTKLQHDRAEAAKAQAVLDGKWKLLHDLAADPSQIPLPVIPPPTIRLQIPPASIEHRPGDPMR